MSEISKLCRKTYQDFIERQPILTELKRSLRVHERVPVFVDNMAAEIHKLQFEVKRETVIKMIEDMTRYFIMAVEQTSKERVMSQVERMRIKTEASTKAIMDKAADAFNNLGVENVTKDKHGETHHQTAIIEKAPD